MKRISIVGLLFCIILAGCATSAPKSDTVDKPKAPEKIEQVKKVEPPKATGPVRKDDPYGGRSLPYGMSFGMSKAKVTAILSKETGGDPKTQGNKLVWSGIAVQNPRIVVVLAAIFENGKLAAFDLAQFGKKTDEVFKRIDGGFNRKFSELKALHDLKDSQITQYRRAALFQTSEGHFLVLLLQTDDKNGLYITELRHLEKLPKK